MEFLLPEDTDARDLLAAHLTLRPGPATRTTSTYYDTFDGRLYADGVTLRHAADRLVLLDRETGEEVAAGTVPKALPKLFDTDLPEALRGRLAGVIEMRALLPVAKLRSQRRLLAVLNGDRKTVVRLAVETHDHAHGRITASALRGYDGDLERVRDVLATTLALNEATVPLVDEAIAATGADPTGTSAKLDLSLDPDQPATAAAATVFARLVEVVRDNLPGTLDDTDSEFLHDLRVAVRRSRSLQRQFSAIYPERLQHFRDEFKRLQAVTGDLRDLDVYLLDFDELTGSLPERMRPDLEPLRALLVTKRARALTATRRALNTQRTDTALAEWAEFVAGAPASERTVRDLASHRIRQVYKKMVKLGTAIDDGSPAEDLHELRKVGKELRYLLEFFSSLYPGEVVKPFIKSLKSLQDQLGRFQDREVQANALRAFAPEIKEHETLMAMGALVQRFMEEEIAARAEFGERFAGFASAEQRQIVKDTFA